MASTTTFTCDRCGRGDLGEATTRGRPLSRRSAYSVSVYSHAESAVEFDLCGPCAENFLQSLQLWLRSKPSGSPDGR